MIFDFIFKLLNLLFLNISWNGLPTNRWWQRKSAGFHLIMSESYKDTIVETIIFISSGSNPPLLGNSTSVFTGGAVFFCFYPKSFWWTWCHQSPGNSPSFSGNLSQEAILITAVIVSVVNIWPKLGHWMSDIGYFAQLSFFGLQSCENFVADYSQFSHSRGGYNSDFKANSQTNWSKRGRKQNNYFW